MATASVFKTVNLTFASLIFIQSLVYGSLSILAILCTHGIIKCNNASLDTLPEGFITGIYQLYLAGDTAVPDTSRVFPKEFFIYIFWMFLLFSIFLAFASLTHIIILAQNGKRKKVNASTVVNLVLVFLSCVYDLLAVVVFAVDYVKIRDLKHEEFLLNTPIYMMTFAAKGYILWFVNYTLAICISVMLRTKKRQESVLEPNEQIFSRTNSIYDAFGDAAVSDGTEMPNNGRRMTQFHRREAVVNPYAQTILDDGQMGLNNAGMDLDEGQMGLNGVYATTRSLDHQKIQEYLEPFDSIAPQSISNFEPRQYIDPQLNEVEPHPDYSPHPDYDSEPEDPTTLDYDFYPETHRRSLIQVRTPSGDVKYF